VLACRIAGFRFGLLKVQGQSWTPSPWSGHSRRLHQETGVSQILAWRGSGIHNVYKTYCEPWYGDGVDGTEAFICEAQRLFIQRKFEPIKGRHRNWDYGIRQLHPASLRNLKRNRRYNQTTSAHTSETGTNQRQRTCLGSSVGCGLSLALQWPDWLVFQFCATGFDFRQGSTALPTFLPFHRSHQRLCRIR